MTLRHPRIVFASLTVALIAGVVTTWFFATPPKVEAATTVSEFCKAQTTSIKLAACREGLQGSTDCNDFKVIDEQDPDGTYKVCADAAAAKAKDPTIGTISESAEALSSLGDIKDEAYKNAISSACAPFTGNAELERWCVYGGIGDGGKNAKPKSISDCTNKAELKNSVINQNACITGAYAGQLYASTDSSGNTDGSVSNEDRSNAGYNRNTILDQLDQTQDLSEYLDVLHKTGQDSKVDLSKEADNNYGSYVNGAGRQQKIKVYPSGKKKSPAIIFINGGGWHGNDLNSDRVMAGENGAQSPKDRGYTGFDVTYRLGSSGVYYMFEDVMRGIQHVMKNADMYGIDPKKVVVWGDSAGGSLAMRAVASGKTGAKVGVGWSPPTNAYTAIFHSYKSLLIGMDHSTCIPTDLAGAANFTDLLNGGSGEVAEYGKDFLSSNGFTDLDGLGSSNMIDILTQLLSAAQYAVKTGQNIESISSKLENGGLGGIGAGTIINMSAKKLNECLDNFNALSPALFASPDTPPSFVAGFTTDDVVAPNQVTGMRDKLLSLGIKSDMMLIEGDRSQAPNPLGPTLGNHLDYDMRFVCPTMNFIDSVIQPERGTTNCKTGVAENATGNADAGGGGASTSPSATPTNSTNAESSDNSTESSQQGNNGGGGQGSGDEKKASDKKDTATTTRQCTYTTTTSARDGRGATTTKETSACSSETSAKQQALCVAYGGVYIADRSGSGNSGCNFSRSCDAIACQNPGNFNPDIIIDTSTTTSSGPVICPDGKPPTATGRWKDDKTGKYDQWTCTR